MKYFKKLIYKKLSWIPTRDIDYVDILMSCDFNILDVTTLIDVRFSTIGDTIAILNDVLSSNFYNDYSYSNTGMYNQQVTIPIHKWSTINGYMVTRDDVRTWLTLLRAVILLNRKLHAIKFSLKDKNITNTRILIAESIGIIKQVLINVL